MRPSVPCPPPSCSNTFSTPVLLENIRPRGVFSTLAPIRRRSNLLLDANHRLSVMMKHVKRSGSDGSKKKPSRDRTPQDICYVENQTVHISHHSVLGALRIASGWLSSVIESVLGLLARLGPPADFVPVLRGDGWSYSQIGRGYPDLGVVLCRLLER